MRAQERECFMLWSREVLTEKQRKKMEKVRKDTSSQKVKEGHLVNKVGQGILGKGTAPTVECV